MRERQLVHDHGRRGIDGDVRGGRDVHGDVHEHLRRLEPGRHAEREVPVGRRAEVGERISAVQVTDRRNQKGTS